MPKESENVRGTHSLESEEVKINEESKDSKRKPTRKWVLTNWRAQRDDQVRAPSKDSQRARGTHILENAGGGQVKTPERRQARGTHFLEGTNGRSKGIGKRRAWKRHSLPEKRMGK